MKSKHSFFKFVSVMILTSLLSACGNQPSIFNQPQSKTAPSTESTPDSSTSTSTLDEITELSSTEEATLQDYLTKIKDTHFPKLDPSIQKKLIQELKEKMLIEAAVLDHDEEVLELALRKQEGPSITIGHQLGMLWLGIISTLAARDFNRWNHYINFKQGAEREFKRLVMDRVRFANLAESQIGDSAKLRSLTREMILTDSRTVQQQATHQMEVAMKQLESRFTRTKQAYIHSLEMIFDGRLRGEAANRRLLTTAKGLMNKLNTIVDIEKTAFLSRRYQASGRFANLNGKRLRVTGTLALASWAATFVVAKVYSEYENEEIESIEINLTRDQTEELKENIAILKNQLRQSQRLVLAYEADQNL